jgi:hypothetical protein
LIGVLESRNDGWRQLRGKIGKAEALKLGAGEDPKAAWWRRHMVWNGGERGSTMRVKGKGKDLDFLSKNDRVLLYWTSYFEQCVI